MEKNEALAKIHELEQFVANLDKEQEWVKIDYSKIPREVFEKYGAKPFEIMRTKMRNSGGEVWNNISYTDAKKEAEKLGYHLPSIQQMLVLLDWYKYEKGENVSCYDKEFLGIEELSYDEDASYEWIDSPAICSRGGSWPYGSGAGAFSLGLYSPTGDANYDVGFRMTKDIN